MRRGTQDPGMPQRRWFLLENHQAWGLSSSLTGTVSARRSPETAGHPASLTTLIRNLHFNPSWGPGVELRKGKVWQVAVHHSGRQSTNCVPAYMCVCLRGAGKKGGQWLLFIGSVLLSYLYHTVLSITQSEYGKSKSCRLIVDACNWSLQACPVLLV